MQINNRIIIHLDLDYFYAQVEELRHPDSKDKPIVVCMYSGRTSDSGAVATVNYVGRKYGVKSGIPIVRAKKLLEGKDATFLRADHAHYAEVSARIMQILLGYADKFEQTSIDEAFLDITEKSQGDYTKAKEIAERIKEEILERVKLMCSVGVAPNKLVAKIASNFQKPNGLTVVKPDESDTFLAYLDVDAIPGIGAKTKEVLEGMSIRTIADLRSCDPTILVEKFGKKTGSWLYQASRGMDESDVAMVEEQKQISRIATLKKNSRDIEEIMHVSEELIKDIKNEIDFNNLAFETVGVLVIAENMQGYTRSKTLAHATNDDAEIKKVARELFENLIASTRAEFRRIGVKVEKLQSKEGQKTLGEF